MRGTSNKNVSGNSEDRRRRKAWLVETYRADMDLLPFAEFEGEVLFMQVEQGSGEPACRCYRCGNLLTVDWVTVDRIKPGCQGGTYRRENIRPACAKCNESTGGKLGAERKALKAAA